ncbi:hypothetical protein CAPTEDRAFT_222094 [Capitella teleta]|uniref:Uncharacterized protein n=1 Tax=Capitella teleta TaxID=283909 RepID=R7TJA8_CAPTE|nr:hypothetical protein CAPTEDRAFT_222094 [Capitella teleta]|eukprot:ELT93888.1 hypothetical protein CAPTEDRAFT_222094 [Capitella teleta]
MELLHVNLVESLLRELSLAQPLPFDIVQNEGRRHLMMDLASTGLMSEAESFKGAIDESAIPPSPPGSKISSGYGSDDDHIYCVNSRTQSQDTTPTLSLSNTPPQTPPAGQLLQQQPPLVESMDVMLASPNDCSGSQRGGRCMGNLDDLQELMSLLESSANSDPWGTSDSMEIDPVEPSNSDLADPKILLGLLTEAKKFCDDQQMVPGDMLLSPGASSCNSAELTPPSDVSSAQTSPLRVTSPPAGEAMPLSLALLQEQSSPQTANAASPLQQQASPSSALSIGLTTLPSRSLDSDGNLLQGTDEMPLKFPQSENVEMVNTSIASYLGQGIQELQTSVPSSLNCSPSPQDQLLQLNAEQALAMDCCNAGSNSTPLVGGNPFLVDTAQHVVSAPQQQQQPMLLVTRSTPPTLSTPTTMYIPTTTGMSSVKLPQTPLNKTSSISLLTPTAKRSLPNGQQRMKPLAIRVPLTASQRPQQQSWPLNPCPKASSLAFRNDHPYTSKQPEGSSTHAAKHKHRNHNHSSHSAMRLSSSSSSSVLETLLTTTKQLNPNDGSEKVLAAEGIQMTSSSSRAAFQQQLQQEEDAMAPLLKKLLTGEMNQREVHKDEQQVIDDRKGTLDPLTSDPFGLDLNVEGLSSLDDTDGGGIDLGLLGAESQGNRIWTPSSPCHDLMSSEMSSELAEILQEQTRQDDLWLQSYLDHTNL